MVVDVKRLRTTARLPERGSEKAAGYDLFADVDEAIRVPPHTTVMIGTGLAVAIPEGYYGGVFARSGLSSKEGLRPANCVGVIDADYRGELKVALHNDSEEMRVIEPQEKIAQLVVCPFLAADFHETDTLSDTKRGEGGFGSTGK